MDSRTFVWEGGDCLYRDARGWRVAADLDAAPGAPRTLVVHAAPEGLELEADGEVRPGPRVRFEDYCVARCPGEGRAVLSSAPDRPAFPAGWAKDGPGSGWVLIEREGVCLDGRPPTPWAPEMGPIWARHWLSLQGAKGLKGAASSGAAHVLLDEWNGWLASEYKSRRGGVKSMSEPYEAGGAALAVHLNSASFEAAIPPGSSAIVLRREWDRFHGRQRARVLVNGEFAGWWYDPEQERTHRLGLSQFVIEGRLVERAGTALVTIDPPAGVALWSVGRMEVHALIDPSALSVS